MYDGRGNWNRGFRQLLALPFLRRWVIHFENAKCLFGVRIAISEGVQPGPENHVLPCSPRDRRRELIFRVTTARRHERANASPEALPVSLLLAREPCRWFGPNDRNRQGIFKHRWTIKNLMRGAPHCNTHRCPARPRLNHKGAIADRQPKPSFRLP